MLYIWLIAVMRLSTQSGMLITAKTFPFPEMYLSVHYPHVHAAAADEHHRDSPYRAAV